MKIILSVIIGSMVFCFNYISLPQSDLKIKEGMKAPNFILQNYNGKHFKLSSYKGKSVVVLYFYPKAGTPGCTKQACGIRDDHKVFKDKNIVVMGISVDSRKEIKKFVDEHNLNFPLFVRCE